MSDVVLVALIAAVASIVSAILGLTGVVVAIRNGRKVDAVAKAADGMKDELVAAVRAQSLAKGHRRGVQDEKAAQEHRNGETNG